MVPERVFPVEGIGYEGQEVRDSLVYPRNYEFRLTEMEVEVGSREQPGHVGSQEPRIWIYPLGQSETIKGL